MAMGVMLFACNKQEEQTTKEATVEIVVGNDLLNEIEKANEAQHQLVIQSIEELKAEGEIVTIDQINERIEENAVGFKSSANLEVTVTISQEKLEKYANVFSDKLLSVVNSSDENTTKEQLLSSFETEKDKFVKEVLDNSSLQTFEKRDIIAYVLITKGRIFTQIDILDNVRELTNGEINTKNWWNNFKGWLSRNEECIVSIIDVGLGTGTVIYGQGIGIVGGIGKIISGIRGIIKNC